MRLIKTLPRYHCDFCSHTSTQAAMERHERICWGNPDRYCSSCKGKGVYSEDFGAGVFREPCHYCGQRDSLKEPQARRFLTQLREANS
jgi:hypothetical protein